MQFSTMFTALALLLMAAPGSAPAQEQEKPPQYLQISEIDVRPGMQSDFVRLFGQMNEALQKSDHPGLLVWQTMGGPVGRFYAVRAVNDLAELEPGARPRWLREAWGEKKAAQFWKQFGETTVRTKVSVSKIHHEMGIPPASNKQHSYSMITLHRNSPGRAWDFAEYLRTDLKPAYEKAGVRGVHVHRRVIGDSVRTWVVARGFNDWAELDDDRLAKSLGEEQLKKLRLKGGEMVDEVEVLLLRFREDLSFRRDGGHVETTSQTR